MSGRKLWSTPLSGILCRAASSARVSPIRSSAAVLSTPRLVSSTFDSSPGAFRLRGRVCSENLKLSWKLFCSRSGQAVDARCWNCNAPSRTAPFLVCESCRSIQSVDKSVDYFQIFGLDRTYEIEESKLEGIYKNWQKKLHPDLVHSKSQKERDYAAEQSARVIDAYRTLSKPLARAIYMMKLEGLDVDQEETISEAELLAEIMELRETVEEADNSEALKCIQYQILDKLKHWSNAFANAFENQNFEAALKSIRRMTYYDRVNEEIVRKL